MESSVCGVTRSLELVRPEGRRVESARTPNNADAQASPRLVPPAPSDSGPGAEHALVTGATDVIGGLIESVRRKVLSIGENYPPYLPVTREQAVDLSEEAAQVTSTDVRHALRQAAPKSLAMAHVELRRLVDASDASSVD